MLGQGNDVPSGSFSQAILAPAGDRQIPGESARVRAYRSKTAPFATNRLTAVSIDATDQPRTVKGCGRICPTFEFAG